MSSDYWRAPDGSARRVDDPNRHKLTKSQKKLAKKQRARAAGKGDRRKRMRHDLGRGHIPGAGEGGST